MIENNAISYRR